MYVFNLYRAAKFIRSVRAHSIPDAVAMTPEFTDAKIHGNWTSAHQWFGLEALELIIDIEATNAGPVDAECPAGGHTTGGFLSRLGVYIGNSGVDMSAFMSGPIDAPEQIPAGSSDAYGVTLTLRSDYC